MMNSLYRAGAEFEGRIGFLAGLWVAAWLFFFPGCSGEKMKPSQRVDAHVNKDVSLCNQAVELRKKQETAMLGLSPAKGNPGKLTPPDLKGKVRCVHRRNMSLAPRVTERILPSGRYFDHVYPRIGMLAVACVRGVDIFDISNPDTFVLCTSVDTPGHAWSVASVNGEIWVSDGYAGITVVDPETKAVTDRWPIFENTRYVYPSSHGWIAVCRHRKGVDILRPAEGEIPDKLAHIDVHARVFYASGKGSTLYLGTMGGGYIAMDMHNPSRPVELWRFTGPERVVWCARAGRFHVLIDRAKGVWLLEDRGAEPPVKKAFLALDDISRRGLVMNDHTLLIAQKSGMRCILMSEEGDLAEEWHIPADNEGRAVSSYQGDVFFSDGDVGLKRFTHRSGKKWTCRSRFDRECLLMDVVTAGKWVYAAHARSGLEVCRIDNDGKIEKQATISGLNYPCAVDIRGTLLGVADYEGLTLYDVSKPATPYRLGHCKTPGRAAGIRLSNRYAFIADWFDGVPIFSIDDPMHPKLLATVPVKGWAIDLDVSGCYLYVCCVNYGVLTVDVSRPEAPVITHVDTLAKAPEGICITEKAMYIVDFNSGLIVFDRTDPACPRPLSFVDMKVCKGVEVTGHLLAVSNYIYGVKLFDIRNAFDPILIGLVDTPGKAYETGFLPDGRSLVVADWHGLLKVAW